MTKWGKFAALPARERVLLGRALLSLVWARVELAVLPFSRLPKGRRVAAKAGPTDAARIAWAVELAARYVPGGTCLPKALAVQRLLAANGCPSALRIGVANRPDGTATKPVFQAHAWVEYNGSVLIGHSDAAFAPLVEWSNFR